MSLLASDVKLPPDLASTFSGIGTNAYNQIGQNYGGAMAKAGSDNSARGLPGGAGSYATQRLGAQEGLDTGNLEAGLGGDLGNTAYKNALDQRNFQQQSQLANIIGAAGAPSLLQEVFKGFGSVGTPLAMMAGMKGGGGPGLDPTASSTAAPMSLMETDPSGFENYGWPGYGGSF